MLKPICKKCGSYDINLKYIGSYEKGDVQENINGVVVYKKTFTAEEEYMNCTCSRCGYKWVEEPLDKYDNVVNKCIKKN